MALVHQRTSLCFGMATKDGLPGYEAVDEAHLTADESLARVTFLRPYWNKTDTAFKYFTNTLSGNLKPQTKLFVALEYLNPSSIQQMLVDGNPGFVQACYVTFKECVKGVDDDFIQELEEEFPTYRQHYQMVLQVFHIKKSMTLWEWWVVRKEIMVWHWKLVRKVVLMQPSSAAAERVFSVVAGAIGKRQHNNMLSDKYAVIGRLRYNTQYVPPSTEKDALRQQALQRRRR